MVVFFRSSLWVSFYFKWNLKSNISTNNSDGLGSNNYTYTSTDIDTSESDTEAEETERGEEKMD
jgi:hypothetical protein